MKRQLSRVALVAGVALCALNAVGCSYLNMIYSETTKTHAELVRLRTDCAETATSLQSKMDALKSEENHHFETLVAQLMELANQLEQLEKEITQIRSQLDELKYNRSRGAAAAVNGNDGNNGNGQPPAEEGDAIYTRALTLHGIGKYAAAAQTFQIFLDKYPTATQACDAMFWLGDSYVAQAGLLDQPTDAAAKKELETKALKVYLDTAQRYRSSKRAPAALFNAARLYENPLNDRVQALETYKQIRVGYPSYEQLASVLAKIRELEK